MLNSSFGQTLCTASAPAYLSRDRSKFQQSRNVLLCVALSVLIEHDCLFTKTHRSKSVVLSNGDISGAYKVDKPEVDTVRTFINDYRFSTFTLDRVRCIAYYRTFKSVTFCCSDGNVNYGTAVCIYKNFHTFHLHSEGFFNEVLRYEQGCYADCNTQHDIRSSRDIRAFFYKIACFKSK